MADENEEVEVVRTKKKVNDVFDDLLESQDQVMEETKKTKDFEEVEDQINDEMLDCLEDTPSLNYAN